MPSAIVARHRPASGLGGQRRTALAGLPVRATPAADDHRLALDRDQAITGETGQRAVQRPGAEF
jgi:hypothetical protein